MNDFENIFGRKPTADDVFEAINKADTNEKALMIAIIATFTKKRKNISDLITTSKGMDMLMKMLKKINDDIPDTNDSDCVVEQGEKVIEAIDNVIASLQKYSEEREKLNEAIRQDVTTRSRINGECIGDSGLESEIHTDEEQ